MRNLLVSFGIKPKKIIDPNAPRYDDVYARGVASCIDVMLVFLLFEWLFTRINQHLLMGLDREKLGQIDPAAGITAVVSMMHEAHFFSYWLMNSAIQFALIGVVYVGVQWAFHTTPGKWLLGLKIVRRHDHTQLPSRMLYIWRYVAYLVSCAPLMIGVIWASFNKERRTWHDIVSGTVVLDTRPRGWYWQQVKRGFRYLIGKRDASVPVEEPVAEPTTEKRHEDGTKPVD